MHIRLSDQFTDQKLLRFSAPSVVMMIFTSIYGAVDGLALGVTVFCFIKFKGKYQY